MPFVFLDYFVVFDGLFAVSVNTLRRYLSSVLLLVNIISTIQHLQSKTSMTDVVTATATIPCRSSSLVISAVSSFIKSTLSTILCRSSSLVIADCYVVVDQINFVWVTFAR